METQVARTCSVATTLARGNRSNSTVCRSALMPTPLEIKKTGATEITVRWDDGHLSVYAIKYLRAECMCADCVSEVTGLRIIDPRTVADDLTVLSAEHVGRYGVKFTFSDRHDHGIYTWERLRELCLCEKCSAAKQAAK